MILEWDISRESFVKFALNNSFIYLNQRTETDLFKAVLKVSLSKRRTNWVVLWKMLQD